jgi:hypothetical protein
LLLYTAPNCVVVCVRRLSKYNQCLNGINIATEGEEESRANRQWMKVSRAKKLHKRPIEKCNFFNVIICNNFSKYS